MAGGAKEPAQGRRRIGFAGELNRASRTPRLWASQHRANLRWGMKPGQTGALRSAEIFERASYGKFR